MADSAASSPRLSVVVPLFNEEDNVAPLVDEIATALAGWDFELVLVDDGSSDATVARIPRRPWLRVLVFERNTGQSAAMHAGLMASRGELLGLLDGCLDELQARCRAAFGIGRALPSTGTCRLCGRLSCRRLRWQGMAPILAAAFVGEI